MIHIQPIEAGDLNEALEIFGKYYSNSEGNPDPEEIGYARELFQKSIDGTGADSTELYVTAKDKERRVRGIMGYRNCSKKFLSFAETKNPLEIYLLFVEKRSTRQGIGERLVQYAKDFAKQNGYTEIIVRSASKFKDTGWKFYGKMHFKEVGSVPENARGESKIFRLVL